MVRLAWIFALTLSLSACLGRGGDEGGGHGGGSSEAGSTGECPPSNQREKPPGTCRRNNASLSVWLGSKRHGQPGTTGNLNLEEQPLYSVQDITLKVVNEGGWQANDIEISLDGGHFSIQENHCPARLMEGAECTLVIRFEAGASLTGVTQMLNVPFFDGKGFKATSIWLLARTVRPETQTSNFDGPQAQEGCSSSLVHQNWDPERLMITRTTHQVDRYESAEAYQIAQSFTAPANMELSKVSMHFFAAATLDGVTLEIRSDDSNKPSYLNLARAQIPASELGGSYSEREFILEDTVMLDGGRRYWIVVRSQGGAAYFRAYSVNFFPEGSFSYYHAGELRWKRSNTVDLKFRLFGC